VGAAVYPRTNYTETRMNSGKTLRKPKLPAMGRQRVSLAAEASIRTGFILNGAHLPLEVRPAIDGFDLIAWCGRGKQYLETLLLAHKAILFRNCGIDTINAFERLITTLYAGSLMEYKDRSTPRRELTQNVYTSTVYPAEYRIALHNEGTYWIKWPLKLIFCCLSEATQGGETPIADSHRIYNRIPVSIREKFERKNVLYVRNYNDGFGLTWQDTFQTRNRRVVEEYCHENQIEFDWKSGDRLRTRQVRPAVAEHPKTGERVWFNHAAFFHVSSLDPAMREALMREFSEDDLPYNTYYGDGSPIERDVLEALRSAYQEEMIQFQWKKGDVMILENMSVCHGRASYSGPRKVITAMAEPFGRLLHQPQ
jgi:alpha-ketoglutarate-dependent taurine dioxygenase